MYKILSDDTAANRKILFQFNNDMNHNYNLRNRVTDLMHPQPRKKFGKMRLSYSGQHIGMVCHMRRKLLLRYNLSKPS